MTMVKKPAGWLVKILNLFFSLQLPALLICLAGIGILFGDGELSGYQACLFAAITLGYAATAGLIWKVVYHLQSIDEKLAAASVDMAASDDMTASSSSDHIADPEETKQETSSWLNR